MNSRERVLTALHHERPDRTPRLLYGEVIGYVPAIRKLLTERCAPKTPLEYFEMDITAVTAGASRLSLSGLAHFHGDRAEEALASGQMDEWGVWWRQAGFHHFAHIESPLPNLSSVEDLERYPWPDLDQAYRYADVPRQVQALHERGLAVAAFAGSIFEQGWYLRGMENLLADMMSEPELAEAVLDRTAAIQRYAAVQFARAGVDIIITGDDVATQVGLMISQPTWQRFLKPRLAATVAAAKAANPAVKLFYHSDGNVEPLIPELIEIGIDILNPVQPECMDPARIKKEYGKHLCFWGTVSVQQTMPFGTPQQVRQEVRERIRTVGHDGGFILAPAHVLEPEVPWENIVAFFEAANESF